MSTSELSRQAFNLSIAELADALDIPPRDALDAVIAAGVREFWHEGHKYRSVDDLKQFLADFHLFDPLQEVEITLNSRQSEWFAQNWDLDITSADSPRDEVAPTSSKPLRRFVASETELPGAITMTRRRLRG